MPAVLASVRPPRCAWVGAALAVALVVTAATVAWAPAPASGEGEAIGRTELVSTDSAGAPQTDFLRAAAGLSGDGRVVVWAGRDVCVPSVVAAAVLPCGHNVHIKDRATGEDLTFPTVGGAQPAVSRDGCTVVFVTAAGFDPRDTFGERDVYAVDRCAGGPPDVVTTVRAESGEVRPLDSDLIGDQVTVSADGRFVALLFSFSGPEGPASLLRFDRDPDGDGDRVSGDPRPTVVESVVEDEGDVLDGVRDPSLSDDGARLVFSSDADPRGGQPLAAEQVWLAEPDGDEFAFTLVSQRTGTAGNLASFQPVVSGDGAVVAFTSFATNLTAEPVPGCQGDDGCVSQVLATTLAGGSIELVSAGPDGATTQDAERPALSIDGGLVAFADRSGALVDPPAPDSTDTSDFGADDILVADRGTGRLTRVSVDPDGQPVRRDNLGAAISSSGRSVAFLSVAGPALLEPDGPGGRHQYVRDRDAALAVDPLDLGPALLGEDRVGATTVTNLGVSAYDIAAVGTEGDFTVVGGTCGPGVRLAPGDSCTVDLRFAPGAAGTATAALTVTSAPGFDANPDGIGTVQGTGVAPPPDPTTTTTAPEPPHHHHHDHRGAPADGGPAVPHHHPSVGSAGGGEPHHHRAGARGHHGAPVAPASADPDPRAVPCGRAGRRRHHRGGHRLPGGGHRDGGPR